MTAKIKLNAASGGGSISIQAPSSSSNNRVISLPDITDGTLLTSQSSLDSTKLSPALTTGKILQVKQTVKTDTFSVSHGSTVDITGLSVTITPSSSSNKILVTYDTNVSMQNGSYHAHIFLVRDSTKIYLGDTEGSRTRSSNFVISMNDGNGGIYYYPVHGEFLDSPATTSATTYKIQLLGQNATMYVNRTQYDGNQSGVNRIVSQITVKEVAPN